MATSQKNGPAHADRAPENEDTGQYHVLDWLEREHRVQQKLCRALEAIADTLPAPVDPVIADTALVVLRNGVTRHIAIQQRLLFPKLRIRINADDSIEALIDRIAADNAADEGLAHDTADQIEAALASGRHENPDMLSYMLRGMFEGRRRHIAWESAVLLPLARERLLPADLAPLSDDDIRSLCASSV